MARRKIRPPQKSGKTGTRFSAAEPPRDYNEQCFSIRFDCASGYCIFDCNQDQQISALKTIHDLSKVKWKELMKVHKHGKGFEKINRSSIKRIRSLNHVPIDQEKFIAFRFCGKAPMVGYRDQDKFVVYWFDRDFSLYDHG